MRWRQPDGLVQLEPSVGIDLARLSGLEGFARAVMVGVIPLAALESLGSKAAVSYVFIGGAVTTLLFTLNIDRLERRLHRRWVLTMAVAFLVVAALMFTFVGGPLFVVAIGLRSAEASMFSVCLSLYIMDYIEKRELTAVESRRTFYIAGSWLVGPSLGVWLWGSVSADAPFLISAVTACLMLAYFWNLRLHGNPVLVGPQRPASNPMANVVRFFGQRNLRIAYSITTSRAIFWAALFVYGPIYVVEAGLPTWVAGGFLSAASGMLFISPLVGRAAAAFGTRPVIIASFALMTFSMLALAVLRTSEPIGVVFWLTGAVGGAALDVLGNIPFMRLVKPRERTAMTTVFSTWREASFLIAPLIAAGALAVGEFWLLYLVLAALLAAAGIAASFLPRRM